MQAGLFRNQETYAFLEPRQQIGFSEYYLPVRGTGGISRANLAAAVHFKRQDDSILISLNVNQKQPDATIRVFDDKTELLALRADLAPEKTWTKTFPVPSQERKYTFELKDKNGEVRPVYRRW